MKSAEYELSGDRIHMCQICNFPREKLVSALQETTAATCPKISWSLVYLMATRVTHFLLNDV